MVLVREEKSGDIDGIRDEAFMIFCVKQTIYEIFCRNCPIPGWIQWSDLNGEHTVETPGCSAWAFKHCWKCSWHWVS